MSTRCQIAFYDDVEEKDLNNFKALIYRHSDGYPEEPGVLPDLKDFFVRWIKTKRLNDMEYTAARCLQFLTNLYDAQVDLGAMKKKLIEAMYPGGVVSTGYGICDDFHGDIEFLYTIYLDRIDVYGVNFEEKDINERVTLLRKWTYRF